MDISSKLVSELLPNINQFSKYKDDTKMKCYIFSLYESLTCEFFNDKFHHYRSMNKNWMNHFPLGTLSKIDDVNLNIFSTFEDMINELTSDFADFDSFMIRVTDYQSLKTIIMVYIIKDQMIYEINFPNEISSILNKNHYYVLKKKIEHEKLKKKVKNPCSIEVMKLKTNRSILDITSQEELECFNVTDDNILEYEEGNVGISKLYKDFQIFIACGHIYDFANIENPDKYMLAEKLKQKKLEQNEDYTKT